MNFQEIRKIAWLTVGEILGLTISDVITGASNVKFFRGDGTWNPVTVGAMSLTAADRLVGRDTAGAGAAEELTVGGGIEFTGAGGVRTSAFTGDVTKTAGGTALTIANDAVTYAKMQNVSDTDKLLGRSTAGAGDVEEIACTAAARSLLDDSTVAAMRTTLGAASVDEAFFFAMLNRKPSNRSERFPILG